MYLLFDIGGTYTRIAKSDNGKTIDGDCIKINTPKEFDKGINLFAKTAAEIANGGKIEAIAGGVAGPLNKSKTALVNAPNLPDWVNKPLASEISKHLGAPVMLENDAAVVGLGEAVEGNGNGYNICAYITVSTGVGGVRIVKGKIDKNAYGFEPGHQIIAAGGPQCPSCGIPGHLESFVSGRGIAARYGRNPEEIDDPQIWDEVATYLAYGLNNAIVHWSPEIVILGGSVIHKAEGLFDKTVDNLKSMGKIFPEIPEIKRSALGDDGGMHGARLLLSQNS